MTILQGLIIALVLILIYILGYLQGAKVERGKQDRQERLAALVDPPRRTGGAPANIDAPTSDIREVKWRNGRFRDGPDNRHPREDA